MKQLSKERLEEIADRRSPSLRWGEAEEMARALLAGMAQDPVAQIEIVSGVLVNERWMHNTLPDGWHDLYATRPAPVVPDAWIPCSERMPDGMVDVSITDGINIGQGWWDGDAWQWQDNYYGVIGKVTHWQPLPAPPKEN